MCGKAEKLPFFELSFVNAFAEKGFLQITKVIGKVLAFQILAASYLGL